MKYVLLLATGLFLLSACDNTAQFKKRVKSELSTGVRNDSLFLGVYLGMPAKTFFSHCWELNKQQKVKEGPNNASVQYNLTELKHPGKMYFYPDFVDDKIERMRLTFTYDAWAPWNKEQWADPLMADVVSIFEKWYGGSKFVELKGKNNVVVFAKVDGNRRISVWKEDDQKVRALIVDTSANQEGKGDSILN